jgi:DNA (cytosine-5)-methyltransferase 1
MINHGGHNLAEEIAEVLASKGYICRYSLLNAAFYGVPQMRERMILIAVHREVADSISLPDPTHWIDLPTGYSGTRAVALKLLGTMASAGDAHHYCDPPAATSDMTPAVTAQDAIGDLPTMDARRMLAAGTLRRGKRAFDIAVPYHRSQSETDYARSMRSWPGFEGKSAIYDHVIRCLPRDYQIFAGLQAGDQYPEAHRYALSLFEERVLERRAQGEELREGSTTWRTLLASIVPPYDASKFPNKWRKMEADRPARTLLAHLGKDGYSHIHYDSDQARPISVREAARLQSFPDGFAFSGTMNPAFRQIGNAVPPLLAWSIAKSLKRQLTKTESAVKGVRVTTGVGQ